MTEITRAPLPPLAKGSLTKLWIGVAAALLVAAGVAHTATPPAVQVKATHAGTGASPTLDDYVLINYKGTLANGAVFDQAQHAIMPVARVVPGFAKALQQMQRGGRYHVAIPPALAYGDHAAGPIPPNSTLYFDIDLIDFRSAAQVQAQQQMMEQMRAAQAARGGAAAGAGAGAPPPQ